MCVKDGTQICERPEINQPCGWCVLVKCPQALQQMKRKSQGAS